MTSLPFAILLAILAQAQPPQEQSLRVATFNIWELTEQKLDQIDEHGTGVNRQLTGAAEIIQRIRPDILLINEIDVGNGDASYARRFCQAYLGKSQNGQTPIRYPHIFVDEVNTGVPSGLDLDNDGSIGGPGDALGYGKYVGQYGMAILSRFPIDRNAIRTFRNLPWTSVPDALIPNGENGKPAWFTAEEANQMPLSSKSHWDVPIRIGGKTLHLLCSHPTPPIFDGKEDRNGRRNFDEIRFWADYITDGDDASYIVDDQDRPAALPQSVSFVILGDLNADPRKDPAPYGKPAIQQLLSHPRIKDCIPKHSSDSTCDFGRIDYVLPSVNLTVTASGIFWPPPTEPTHRLVRRREASSDHRMVWVDIKMLAE